MFADDIALVNHIKVCQSIEQKGGKKS